MFTQKLMKNLNQKFKNYLIVIFCINLCTYIMLLTNPIAFQKTQFIKFKSYFPINNYKLSHNLEKNFIDAIKSTINLRSKRIKQSQSFQVSINGRIKDYFEGIGNCSNQCYAILPKASYLNGDDHSLLLFKPSNLLYDPLLNKFYQFVQLPQKSFKIIDNSQNPLQYILDFNSGNSFLGITPGQSIRNYLNFMNKLNLVDFPGAINVIIHEYLAIIFFKIPIFS